MSSRIRFSTARQVFDAYEELAEDIDTLPSDADPIDYLKTMLNADDFLQAATFCAYLLPKREAIWWALNAVRYVQPEQTTQSMRLLTLVDDWVREPGGEIRAKAAREAETSDRRQAATWVAYAVAWTGGSMSPIEDQHVPPPKALTAKACRAAILIAVSANSPVEQSKLWERTISAGVRFAQGESLKIE